MMMDPLFILASSSPRRKYLFKKLGLPFQSFPSSVDEYYELKKSPGAMTLHIAFKKANSIAEKHPDNIIIGADTLVVLGSEILGKPKSHREAFQILRTLSGKTHIVYTGVVLIKASIMATYKFVEKTKVTFYPLTPEMIKYYITNYDTLDKAGAYGIQDWAACFVKSIEGCYHNVVGFPLSKFFHVITSKSFQASFGSYNWLGKVQKSP